MPTRSPSSASTAARQAKSSRTVRDDEVVELVGALGRVGPRPVQVAALAHHLEERVAVGEDEVAQLDTAARAAWRACAGTVSGAAGRRSRRRLTRRPGDRACPHETAPGARGHDRRAPPSCARERPARLRDRRARRRAARAGRRRALGARAERRGCPRCGRAATPCCAPPPALAHRAGPRVGAGRAPAARARRRRAAVPGEPGAGRHRARVVVLHDAAPLRHPGWYSRRLRGRAAAAAAADRAPRAARRSPCRRSRARELAELLGLAPERVSVVPGGVDAAFSPGADAERARAALGLARPYVLCVASQTARKNLAALVPAARALAGEGVDVVVAGGHRPQFAAESGPRTRCGCSARSPTRCCPGSTPARRRSRCPSHYEGFGLPVLEAMAAGTPVVAADATALPETCGGAARLVAAGRRGVPRRAARPARRPGRARPPARRRPARARGAFHVERHGAAVDAVVRARPEPRQPRSAARRVALRSPASLRAASCGRPRAPARRPACRRAGGAGRTSRTSSARSRSRATCTRTPARSAAPRASRTSSRSAAPSRARLPAVGRLEAGRPRDLALRRGPGQLGQPDRRAPVAARGASRGARSGPAAARRAACAVYGCSATASKCPRPPAS